MNKQFLLSVVVLFIASMMFDFVVHAVLLDADYKQQPALMRTEADAQRHFPAMLLAHAFIAVASCVPTFLIYYAVQPTGLMVAVKQICFGSVATVLTGLVVAALNKPAA